MPSLREIEDFVIRAEIEGIKEECGFETKAEKIENIYLSVVNQNNEALNGL
jgi:hypothetical protein